MENLTLAKLSYTGFRKNTCKISIFDTDFAGDTRRKKRNLFKGVKYFYGNQDMDCLA